MNSDLPIDVEHLLSGLAVRRPVFHSEADFQHELAWQIRESIGSEVRLEFPYSGDNRRLDIWLPQQGMAIELKYCTRGLRSNHHGEDYALRDQSAQDTRRYDFLNDVQRLENARTDREDCKCGLAIFLTNDPTYWQPSKRTNTQDAAFRLHEGRTIKGGRCLGWAADTGPGTMKGRESPLDLKDEYEMKWRHYSTVHGRHGEFRYLALVVAPSSNSIGSQ